MQAQGYKLSRPCPKCPFRTDVPPYLRGERAQQIATDLLRGSEFHCHQTTVADPDDDSQRMAGAASQFCAGALIMLEKAGAANQIMRVAERLGMYRVDRLDMDAPVHDSPAAFVQHHDDEPDADLTYCAVVDAGCDAPAGWMEGGAPVPNLEPGECSACDDCGEPVCENCATIFEDDYLCASCLEYREGVSEGEPGRFERREAQ